MTAAQMITMMSSLLDDKGGVAPFWVNPQDYYDALNTAQRELLDDLIEIKDVPAYRALVVKETLADGTSLANRCRLPLSVRDSATPRHVTIKDVVAFTTYLGVGTPSFAQASVYNGAFHTNPAAQTWDVVYLREPLEIGVSQDCELSPVVHVKVVDKAKDIMLHKSLDAPQLDLVETQRNKEEIYSKKKPQPQTGYFPEPREIPYSTR